MKPRANHQLKFEQLRLVASIGDHGQLGRAAEALGVTQPAASRMLAEIERRLGAAVCTRHPKGMALTLVGEALARRARRMTVEFSDLAREIDELKSGGQGTVRVGAVTGGAVGYVAPAIRQLKAVSPEAEVYVSVAPSDELVGELLAGDVDFVLARLPHQAEIRDFDIWRGRSEAIDLLVHRDHPLSMAAAVSLQDLGVYGWVMQPAGAPITEAVKRAFVASGAETPTNITNTSSLLVMIAALAESLSIAPIAREVSELLTGPRIGARLVRLPLQEQIEVAPYDLISARGRNLSPIANRLRAMVRAELNRQRA